ncbi:hypothetical protein N7457_005871 [Penicillium paradoxum]|uniref:uncharacterized protein n=1 Tax=Penicillium paradoxum TaxID=176176 RepID=UPI0025494826|nr:uncharacterized protein N7457_005871 [Penicillium paradoxum]KAJ5780711.1 hypothetical protein N7457_005871 [Penicillium paradoxum]
MKLAVPFMILGQSLFGCALASPWFGTKYLALFESTIVPGFTTSYYTDDPIVRTRTDVITPTVTNPPVLSTVTNVKTNYGDVTAIELFIDPTAGIRKTEDDLLAHYATVTYTAPSSCSYTTSQTLITVIPIAVPSAARDLVRPSVITATIKFDGIESSYTRTWAMLQPSEIPISAFSSASSLYMPAKYSTCNSYYSSDRGTSHGDSSDGRYSGCKKFTWYINASAFSGGYCCSDGCHYTWGISPPGLGLAVFFSWFGLFIIIGLIESWVTFRRAMLGREARRGLPYGFAFLCPALSCVFLFTVKKYPAKSAQEQAVLVGKWKDMSGGAKVAMWLKYLFRRKDPAVIALGRGAPVA